MSPHILLVTCWFIIILYNILAQRSTDQLCAAACDHIKDETKIHMHLKKRIFLKMLCHIFVPC